MDIKSLDVNQLKKENEILKKKLYESSEKIKELESENLTAFAIGDAIIDGIYVINEKGIIVNVNAGFTEITDIPPSEVIGVSIKELKIEKYFKKDNSFDIMNTKEKTTTMATVTRNNKRVLMVGKPIFNEKGDFVKIIVIIRDITSLVNLKEKLEKVQEKKREIQNQLNDLRNPDVWNHFKGTSDKIEEIKELIKYVAPTDATVLILGKTGSGKEVVAREIHERSKRKNGPYVKINCAAIPENLLESELFGYFKGAFTGADNKNKKGLFEIASGGTILLDEITELPMNLQPKLLRVLQEREINPLGGVGSIKIDTRVIASCNQNPETLIKEGLFRADLYYRLNVFPIEMPDLKERRQDIPDIAMLFLEKFNNQYNKNKTLGNTAIHTLKNYDWPGNVRELENTIERLVIISVNKILTNEDVNMVLDINENHDYTNQKLELELGKKSLKESVKDLERELVQKALDEGGSSYAAAKLLKTTQPTIIRKAQALGIKTSRNN